MYGIIHRSLQQMIVEQFGAETWNSIALQASISEAELIGMENYADEITERLIKATGDVLSMSRAGCLEMLGRYWMLSFAPDSFGSVLDATGRSFVSFVGNLNLLHDRIASTFQGIRPPEFRLNELGDQRYTVDYLTNRQGLSMFARGALEGVALRYGQRMELESQVAIPRDEGEHWRYTLRLHPRNAWAKGSRQPAGSGSGGAG